MGFFRALWGSGKMPTDPEMVSRDEFQRTKYEFDRKLRELDEALHALRGDEPDRWEQPHAP